MLEGILKKEYINITDLKLNWKDAIKLSAKPLVDAGVVEVGYIDNMIENVEVHGPYIDLGKGIAIAHSKNYKNINGTGMSILKLNVPTYILEDKNHKIDILITLASKDDNEHLGYLANLTTTLSDEKKLIEFKAATTIEHIYNVVHNNDNSVKFGTICGESLVSSFMIKQNISTTLKYWGIREKVEIYCFDLEGYKESNDIDMWFINTELKDKVDLQNLVVIDSIIDKKELEDKLKTVCEELEML